MSVVVIICAAAAFRLPPLFLARNLMSPRQGAKFGQHATRRVVRACKLKTENVSFSSTPVMAARNKQETSGMYDNYVEDTNNTIAAMAYDVLSEGEAGHEKLPS